MQDIMLVAPAILAKYTLPHMKEKNFGRIINIGSIHSLITSNYKSSYVSAKHGLLGLSKVLGLETASHNITINTICPSYVKTPLVDKQIADQAKQHNISKQEVIEKIMLAPMPKKAFIEFEEIAHSVDFFLSDLSKNITGEFLSMDGGWTIQ